MNDARPDPSPDQAGLQRLRRTALYELQTGGGLSLDTLDGPGSRPPDPARVARVHELARALRQLRPAAPARAVAALSARKKPDRVLDLGAGRAPWSLAFTRLNSDVQVTAVDLPREVPALRAAVTAAGRAHQYRFVAVDFFDRPVESLGSFDLVIVANVCHLFTSDLVQRMLQVATNHVAEGGAVAVIDQLLDDDPDWTRWSALYLVGLPHLNPGGHLFTAREYTRWFEDLGLTVAAPEALCPVPALSLVVATRP